MVDYVIAVNLSSRLVVFVPTLIDYYLSRTIFLGPVFNVVMYGWEFAIVECFNFDGTNRVSRYDRVALLINYSECNCTCTNTRTCVILMRGFDFL